MFFINNLIDYCTNMVSSGGIIFGFLLVFIEGIVPQLPLSLFVALNVNAFGFIIGVLLSWCATCCGSYICYYVFYKFSTSFYKFLSNSKFYKLVSSVDYFKNISISKLVFFMTLPFSPSYCINVLCGLSGFSNVRFIISLIIGKLFSIIFWGYIGNSLINNLTDIKSLLFISLAILLSYVVSKCISKIFNLE